MAHQQEQEERSADEGRHHAQEDLLWGGHGAGQEIGADDEPGAGQERGRQQPAMDRSQQEAHEVRHDEADEADDTTHRDRAAGEDRRAPEHGPLRPLDVDPERGGHLLAFEQQVQVAREPDRYRTADDHSRQQHPGVDPARSVTPPIIQ